MDALLSVVTETRALKTVNSGFRYYNGLVMTYDSEKIASKPVHFKRIEIAPGVTRQLDL